MHCYNQKTEKLQINDIFKLTREFMSHGNCGITKLKKAACREKQDLNICLNEAGITEFI